RHAWRAVQVLACALVCLLGGSGCGDDGGATCAPSEDAGRVDGERSASKKIGAAGGSLKLSSGAEVVIPKGALREEIEISVTELLDAPPFKGGKAPAGKAFAFEPHGTKFQSDVSISVPFEGQSGGVVLAKLDDERDQDWDTVGDSDTNAAAKRLTAQTRSFSIYCAARDALEPSDDGGPSSDAGEDAGELFDVGMDGGDAGAQSDAAAQLDAAAADATPADTGAQGEGGAGDAGDPCATSSDACVPGALKQLAAGAQHACALYTNGPVYCWGSNTSGSTGQGQSSADRPAGRVVLWTQALLSDATMIASNAVADHTCAVRADRSVVCWGRNDKGQCGADAPANIASRAYAVPGVTDAVAVGVGGAHSCAVQSTGQVVCWGDNASGQRGTGDAGVAATPNVMLEVDPAAVSKPISDAVEVAGGSSHTCVVHAGKQSVSCVGSNSAGGGWQGLLGRGSVGDRVFPLAEKALLPAGTTVNALRIGAGFYAGHTCVLPAAGRPICWGTNTYSQLAPTGGSVASPTPLDAYYAGPTAIALGFDFTCVAYTNAVSGPRVGCQGNNGAGQLGDGTSGAVADAIPDDVGADAARASFLGAVEQLVAGRQFVCAKLVGSGVSCWGGNGGAVLGATGPNRSYSDASALVPGLP
ncbi:MAG TPA: hypothetical protein VFZ61_22140, partial [Polyangiales bacterium]